MFINIVNRKYGHSSIYECNSIHFNKISNAEGEAQAKPDETIFVDLKSDKGCITLELEKKYSNVFIMNNQGKTIDSYYWNM